MLDMAQESTWICGMSRPAECGPIAFGEGEGKQPTITLKRSDDGAYDGTFDNPPGLLPAGGGAADAAAARPSALDGAPGRGDVGVQGASGSLPCAAVFLELAERYRGGDDAYSAACCFALAGKADRAFELLTNSVAWGYRDADGMEKDLDFVSLRSDPRWSPLVERVRHPKDSSRAR